MYMLPAAAALVAGCLAGRAQSDGARRLRPLPAPA